MKHIAQSLGLGLALLAASSISPRAADWAVGSGGVIKDFGSIKDYKNAAVPVPAPTPAPSYSKDWYVRGDIGYDMATNADVTPTGGITARNGDDLNGFLFGSIGAGRYITPSLRAEMTFDFRPKKTVTQGTQYYSTTVKAVGTPVAGGAGTLATTDSNTYAVTQQDDSGTAHQTAMFNLFYDFRQGHQSRFTPYIGAGLGLASSRYKRVTSQSAHCTGTVNTIDSTGGVGTVYAPGTCSGTAYDQKFNDDKYTAQYSLAAAIMLGAGYEVAPGITLDAGYRLAWDAASLKLNAGAVNGATSITVGNRIDHELRTGVRFDLN